ncbi:MAG TPA: TIGR03435 family protein [Terriglobales bacterium]|nr:TIGR03435 family protein [Terriglobales bacterium]
MFVFAAFWLALLCAPAQQSPRLHFDVVSVKPTAPTERGSGQFQRHGDRWAVQGAPFRTIVAYAFHIPADRVEGIPAGWQPARYDIDARMPVSATDAQFHLMLQTMLAERFHMAWHIEMRPADVSLLTLRAPGPDLHPSSGHCLTPGEVAPPGGNQGVCGAVRIVTVRSGAMEIAGSSVTMAEVASFFTFMAVHPVFDESGSKALYDFDITVSNPAPVAGESPDQRLFESEKSVQSDLRRHLGVELDMTHTLKRPMPVLIIDHIESATAN